MKKTKTKALRRVIAMTTCMNLFIMSPAIAAGSEKTVSVANSSDSITKYSYEVIPILEPFNEYFFVKTDNPDPDSFRFVDKKTVYGESADIYACETCFADIKYENTDTLRVNGGYIFQSFYTDGGEICLQELTQVSDGWYYYDDWTDTDKKFTLPALCDDCDYLINTYATEQSFFDNMDAVEAGFGSICLYSGSTVRGEVYRAGANWSLSTSPHVDQSLYIQSPYTRKDTKYLFASSIYPFRYDSIGFPSMMGLVSERLSSDSSYEWNDSCHWLIDVTYNGETRSYGGAGGGEGQGLSQDKITHYFNFDGKDSITLSSIRQLLDDYSKVEMEDDIPRDDILTWEQVGNTVDDGAWVYLTGIASIFGSTFEAYTYLYVGDDRNEYYGSEFGVGANLFGGGSLVCCSDVWVDGRYICEYEFFVPGETFEQHPTSGILLTDVTVPVGSYDYYYQYDYSVGEYVKVFYDVELTEGKRTVCYYYSEEEDAWLASSRDFNYYDLVEMVDSGLIDEKYLDNLKLSHEEVDALDVDRNTNLNPQSGFIYDGSVEAGTEFKTVLGDVNDDGKVTAVDARIILQAAAGNEELNSLKSTAADVNKSGDITAMDARLALQKAAGNLDF